MKKINYDENKIILVNNYYKFILNLDNIDDFIIINPLVKISDLFSFKNKNIFNNFFMDNFSEDLIEIFNNTKLENITKSINQILDINLVENNYDLEKNAKNLFEFDKDLKVNEKNLFNILKIINDYSDKNLSIIIYGFEISNFEDYLFSKLNIFYLINSLINNIKINHLEMLLIDKNEEIIEIFDKEKLITFLELETKVVVNEEKITNYLNNSLDYESYLIDNVLKKI